MKNLFIFGDSIGVGQYIQPHLTWVHMLSEWLNSHYNDIIIQNASRNGDTTRLALERMPSDIQKYRPEFIVIQFGINDANYWQTDVKCPRVSPEAFKANLIEIIGRAKIFGARKIILNTNHLQNCHDIFPNTVNLTLHDTSFAYNEIIRQAYLIYKNDVSKFTQKCNVYLNDIEKWIKEEKIDYKSMTLDGVHLNRFGHDQYFRNMVKVLKKEIKGWLR